MWGIQVACGSVSAVLSPAFSPGYHCSNFPAAYRQGFASDLQHEMRPTVFGALLNRGDSLMGIVLLEHPELLEELVRWPGYELRWVLVRRHEGNLHHNRAHGIAYRMASKVADIST